MDHTLDLKTLRKADPAGASYECSTQDGKLVFIDRGHPLWSIVNKHQAADYALPPPDYAALARAALDATDWRIVKAAETNAKLSPDWLAWRAAVRLIAGSGAGPIPDEPFA